MLEHSSKMLRALTWVHGVLFGVMVYALLGVVVTDGLLFDKVAPVALWLWFAGAPLLGGAALCLRNAAAERRLKLVNRVLLGLWAVALVISLLMH